LALWAAEAPVAADGDENRTVLDLPPSKDNPRNSEGAFITLQSGRILFVYTQFYGGHDDQSPARLAGVFSDDGGVTWPEPPQVIVPNDGGCNVMSVSLLRLAGGRIALFYLVKNSFHDCRPVVRFSDDEARTWTEPKPVFTAPGYFVLNNDRVIQTRAGRLVMPVAFHRSRDDQAKNHRTIDYRALDLWYLSDDEGKTWREADSWWGIPVQSRTGLHEPGVVELASGVLQGWARTDQGCQYGTLSVDGGKTWTPPTPFTLKSPVSPASIKRLPDSGKLLAVWNDHSGDFPFQPGKRTPLVAGISSDDGRTWPVKKVLEDDPKRAYCYIAIHYAGDAVLFGYCAGEQGNVGLNHLRIRRTRLDWLMKK